jgi:hypothetical protein
LTLTQLGETNSILVWEFWAASGDREKKAIATTDNNIEAISVKGFSLGDFLFE